MKLATFLPPGADVPVSGEIRDGHAVAFENGESVLDRLQSGERTRAGGQAWALDQVRLLAPISRPGAIFCVALNYAKHAAEGDQELPDSPSIFLKPSRCSAPPDGPVVCPDVVRRLDYEAELAVIIGHDGQIAGYAVANDVSGRDLQKRERHWTRAKGADSFCPWGPWITTADEIADPGRLAVRSWVNGEARQDGNTADMIFSPQRVIDFLAQALTLEAGDLLLTGTPDGVGFALDPPRFLTPGDRVRVEIEELGWIEHEVVAQRQA